jgi:ABC-type Na+ transport system ATPase subunit NatA
MPAITLTSMLKAAIGCITAVFSRVEEGAIGKAGDIRIITGSLSVTNGGQLIANVDEKSSFFVRSQDSVSAGDILTIYWQTCPHQYLTKQRQNSSIISAKSIS